jgi:hypothetical protein
MCEDTGVEVSLCWDRHGNFPRLTRIRENAGILERLQAMRTETISGNTVLALCKDSPCRHCLERQPQEDTPGLGGGKR